MAETDSLDGKGAKPNLNLVSVFTDQIPEDDTSRKLEKSGAFKIYDSAKKALTLGTGKLTVDGVMLIAEHGKYPELDTGQIQYPKRRLFSEVLQVFDQSK